MHQRAVFSPLIVGKLYTNTRGANLTALRQLETETLLIDGSKAMLAELAEILREAQGDQLAQGLIEGILDGRLSFEFIESVRASKRRGAELRRLVTEAEVGETGRADFLVGRADGRRTESDVTKRGLRLYSVAEYVSPAVDSIIRPLYVRHPLLPGDKFDFERWFGVFLQDAKSVKIADGYIGGSPAIENFETLVRLVPAGLTIKVETLSDKARNRHNSKPDGVVVADLLTRRSERHGVEVQVKEFENKTDLGARWVQTDRFTIDLSKGLGFCKNGKVTREQVITVSYRG